MKIVLISPYEIGRQPFGLAQPAAWLESAGHEVQCLDLSLQKLDEAALADASMIAIYVAMHTATRIAFEALKTIRRKAPEAMLVAYGLYAPMNAQLFNELGVGHVFGGESEPDLLALANAHAAGRAPSTSDVTVNLSRIDFKVPQRTGLPALDQYASLLLPDGSERTVGFAETTRGCKHVCRHCPVVPVYEGRFVAIPASVVLEDIAYQVGQGAQHISFGDPDFLNGPTHALRIVQAMHREHPEVTFDATIKVEHLLAYDRHLAMLRDNGCLFVISAVESVDEQILENLAKGHKGRDFDLIANRLREVGIGLSPTFVPFTPWTTLESYLALLERLVELELVESVAPIQLAIRLLVPSGSKLFDLDGFENCVEPFDADLLGHPWRHAEPALDALQQRIQTLVEQADLNDWPRRTVFEKIWRASHQALGLEPPILPLRLGQSVAHLSEPWYCCAEPTSRQLEGF